MTETAPVLVLAGNPAQPPYPLYTSQRLSVSPTIHRNDQHPVALPGDSRGKMLMVGLPLSPQVGGWPAYLRLSPLAYLLFPTRPYAVIEDRNRFRR